MTIEQRYAILICFRAVYRLRLKWALLEVALRD